MSGSSLDSNEISGVICIILSNVRDTGVYVVCVFRWLITGVHGVLLISCSRTDKIIHNVNMINLYTGFVKGRIY